MFGEQESESPRLPSPWISRSLSTTPSNLSLLTPPPTPPSALSLDASNSSSARRGRKAASSIEEECILLERDLNSISLAQGRFHEYESEEVIIEHVKVVNGIPHSVALMPEVDSVGHIEYKLRLSRPTSLHRLERLRTQCKWRLVQGGGKAVYELGVLDNGVLIGLSKGEMKESLETLGRMLSGLGGGRVKITRVMKLGNEEEGTKDEEETGFESFEVEADENDSTFIPYIPPTLLDESTPSVSLPASTTTTTTTTQPIDIDTLSNSKGPTPYPSNRTPAEQAEIKRSKRDARRHRRNEGDLQHPRNPSHPNSHFVHSHPHCVHPKSHAHPHPHAAHPHPHSYPEPKRTPFNSHPGPIPPRQKPPRPPKPPRRNKLREREEKQRVQQQRELSLLESGREGVGMKPVIKMGEGEVRWVVEALVEKRGGTSGARRESVVKRKGSDSSDSGAGPGRGSLRDEGEEILTFGEEEEESALVSDQSHTSTEEALSVDEEEEEDDEGCEGWNFLSFDLKELSASVKASAAAASSL